jgi:hypothetical protein
MNISKETQKNLGLIVIFLIIGISLLVKRDNVEDLKIISESPIIIEEVQEVEEIVEETIEVDINTTNEIVHYSNDSVFVVPYPDYNNFSDAFSYARNTLGDSLTNNSLQIFIWNGNKYHTETLKQK